MPTIRTFILFLSLVLLAAAPRGHGQENRPAPAPRDRPLLVLLLVDASGSIDHVPYGDGTLRDAFMDVVRMIIRAVTEARGDNELLMIRVCGIPELTYRGTVRKRDWISLGNLIQNELDACDASPTPDPTAPLTRSSGTDLTASFRMMGEFLAGYPDHDVVLLVLTDGFNQPPELDGEVDNEATFAALLEVAAAVESDAIRQAVAVGIDSSIYAQWDFSFVKAFPGVGRAYGISDMAQGVEAVIDSIRQAQR